MISLPTLSTGCHSPHSGQACVMEYVSLLAGEPWSDRPACTHPALAAAARDVNDFMLDENRHLLVPLIGRLFGTADVGSEKDRKRVSVGLAKWSAAYVNAASAYAATPAVHAADAAYAAAYADAAAHASDATAAIASAVAAATSAAAHASDASDATSAAVEFLTGLIDEYDRLTGRTEHRQLSDADLSALHEQVVHA